MRIIFHVDVNNAFLSWTALYLLKNGYNRDIREIPAVIAGDEATRHGIIVAKSTPAKKYGIVSAEPVFMAKKKCPKLEVFPPNYDFYLEMSNKFYDYLKDFTPIIEQASIDECFLDFTNTKYLYDDIISLAYKMKEEIKAKFNFTVNIGIGNNKLCAKMASDFEKPDKVHTLFMNEIEEKMWPLPVSSLLFVGKSSVKILESIGIKTIHDLAVADLHLLQKYFKNRSLNLIRNANGIDESIVDNSSYQNKCLSISRTLEKDTSDEKQLKRILLDMSNKIGLRARKEKLYAKTVAITFKTSSFKAFSHQVTLVNSINNTMDIYHEITKLFDLMEKNFLVRSIGIRLGDLENKDKEQISLFDNKKDNDSIQQLMDNINNKYQSTVILPAIFYENKK